MLVGIRLCTRAQFVPEISLDVSATSAPWNHSFIACSRHTSLAPDPLCSSDFSCYRVVRFLFLFLNTLSLSHTHTTTTTTTTKHNKNIRVQKHSSDLPWQNIFFSPGGNCSIVNFVYLTDVRWYHAWYRQIIL